MLKRKEYTLGKLEENSLPAQPIILLETWIKDAIQSRIAEPLAATLATIGENGKPSSRMILIKKWTSRGLVFFSNYNSRKGKELKLNPNVALTFFWPALERQVRIEGQISKLPADESDAYFSTRPFESQVGAVISRQSEQIDNRDALEESFFSALGTYSNKRPERPDHWGGYLISVQNMEFWQGRKHRLNDRILYTLENKNWKYIRLQP